MSQEALTTACVKILQKVFGKVDDRTYIDARPPGGKPPADCGETFIAVCDGAETTSDLDFGLDEKYGVDVMVTVRFAYVPDDRAGTEVIDKAKVGLNAVCAQVRAALHMNYDVLTEANHQIGDGAFNGFIEPLRINNAGKAEEKHAEWFSAVEPEMDQRTGAYMNVGWAKTMSFGGARRVQGMPAAGYPLS